MNILVIGSGGREHAIVKKLKQSKHTKNIYAIPGNPGIALDAFCFDINPLDNDQIYKFAKFNNIDLIIPGSETFLENGIADRFVGTKIKVFGPTKKAAQIESSKSFAKELMIKYDIPTAMYKKFTNYEDALNYIKNINPPYVIKYDGLAAGKGVVIASNLKEATNTLNLMLQEKKYGNDPVIIEEFLEGDEFSLIGFVHDNQVIPLSISQDHKRLLDNDLGPNTGGMGVYTPVDIINQDTINDSINNILVKTVEALNKENIPYTGFLYCGLIATKNGPKVIEFNARLGDPETEVILPKLDTDILDIINNLYNHKINDIIFNNYYYTGVVLVSKGYPNSYEKGHIIKGITKDMIHMGTLQINNDIVTNGGRVLLVIGKGNTLEESIQEAYKKVKNIKCDNLEYRLDIGKKGLR